MSRGYSVKLTGLDEHEQKRYFGIVLAAKEGHVQEACRSMGISRRKYRQWIDEDEEFAEDCRDVIEGLVDLSQSMLVQNIKQGISKDIQYMLKTQGRARGYGDKIEHEHSGLIGHAHAHGYFPPEPKTIEEWERQVADAKQASKLRDAQAHEAIDAPSEPVSTQPSVPHSLALVPV